MIRQFFIRTRGFNKLLALACSFAFLLSGCSSSSSTSIADDGTEIASTINVGLALAPTNLDIRNTSGVAVEQILLGNVYETLFSFDENQSMTSRLLSDWHVSEDSRTYDFELREGIHFSNSHTIDAQIVVDSIKDVLDNKLRNYQKLGPISEVTAVDARKLQIILEEPYADFFWYLSGRAGIVYNLNATFNPQTEAIGSGPYLVSEFKENESLTLVKNDNYWGGRDVNGVSAQTNTIVIHYISDPNAQVNALLSGDVDVMAPVVENLLPSIEEAGEFQYQIGKGTDKFTLAFNNKSPKLTNQAFRAALRRGIDHNAIIAARGGKADLPLYGPIPESDPGYVDFSANWAYAPTVAKAEVAELHPDGQTLTLKYANEIYGNELGDLLKSQLAEIGVTIVVEYLDFTTWLNDVYTNKDYELTIVDQADAHDFINWANPDYYFNYDNPEVQKLYQQAMSAASSQETAKLLAQASAIVSNDAAADWLFNYQTIVAYQTKLKDFPINYNQSRLNLVNVTLNL
jgi:peptide/nickel transport system substrate-binding protein